MSAQAAIIDVEFSAVVDAAMVGSRIAEPVREFHPTVLASTALATTQSPRDAYVEFLKSTALAMGKKAVLTLLIPQLPKILTSGFLGAIFSPLLGFVVSKVLEIAIRETEIGMFFLYIDLRTSMQGRDFEKAARANLEKQKTGSPEEKAKAEKELIDAFKAFVKLTN